MKPLLLTYALLCGGDSATTHYALAHGAREAWLPTQNPYAVHAMVGAQWGAVAYSMTKFDQQGRGKLARRVMWVAIAARAATVAYNLHQVTR